MKNLTVGEVVTEINQQIQRLEHARNSLTHWVNEATTDALLWPEVAKTISSLADRTEQTSEYLRLKVKERNK